MAYKKLWDAARVREVLTTESRQKARALFLQTHRPFQRMRLDFSKEGQAAGSFITEEELRALVQAGPLDAHNRLFLIVGEAGSGKSELCQWLEYSADPARHLAVHIPRSMTSAAHVTALLRERLGTASAHAAPGRAPLSDQAAYVAHSAVVLLYEHAPPALAPLDRWAELLRADPLRQLLLEHLSAAATGNWSHMLLGAEQAVAELCDDGNLPVNPAQLPAVAQALRRLLGRALEQTLWLGDVRALLTSLSEQAIASGRRPLLLLEDITAFQLLGDRLLDHLLDLSSGHSDAVIGITTGYERSRLAEVALSNDLTHVHHRLTARCVLTDEQGRAYGFEDDLVDFTRGYLHAVRGQRRTAPPFGNGLYPFTETALHRALLALHEEGNPRQTPRLFLEHVLGAALLSADTPPQALDRSAYLIRPPLLCRSDIADPALQSLLRWYGEASERHIWLDTNIADAFGVAIPSSLLTDGMIQVERAYVPQVVSITPTAAGWQTELRELQTWLSDGGLYPSREILKRGIERVLLSLGDPRSLSSPHSLSLIKAEIYYSRGDEYLPIVLGRESGDQPSSEAYVKVQVQGTPEERGLLEELAYLQLSGASMAQVCQNVALTLEWARQHWESYHTDIGSLLTRKLGGLSPDLLVWSAWQLIRSLEDNSQYDLTSLPPLPRGEGAITPQGGEVTSALSYDTISPWSARDQALCYTAGEALFSQRELIRRLFVGMFMLRDTMLDQNGLAAMPAALCDTHIQQLAAIPLKSLKTLTFKIRPGNHNLYGLLAPLQRYAEALTRLDLRTLLQRDQADLQRREAHLRAQLTIDTTLLQRQLAELRQRCGAVGLTWRETWDAPLSALDSLSLEELAKLHHHTQEHAAQAAQLLAAGCACLSYQRFRHTLRPLYNHWYWPALAILSEIQAALLQRARGQYRRDGRLLTGTREYQALIQHVRAIWQEMNDAP